MLVNTRVLHAPVTGVQRFINEVLKVWPGEQPATTAPPEYAARGPLGHAWEQFVLPMQTRGELLWSPVHSGPLRYANQVVTLHDAVPLDHPEWLNPNFARWYRFMLPRLIRRARHVIAVSEFNKKRILNCVDVAESKITVIPNGVSDSFHPEQASKQAAMRKELSIPEGRYVLTVSSLEPRKNLASLLAAWQRALPLLPDDWYLLVVGAANRRVFASGGPSDLPDRVLHLGHLDGENLEILYAAAECFIYLSLYEGFGLPPLEAMASGTPVIVSDIEVMNEVVGDCALKVPPLDIDAIARALQHVSQDDDLRGELATSGLKQASQFSWRKTAEQTHALLTQFE